MPLGNAHLQLQRLSRTKPGPLAPGLRRKNSDESTASTVSTSSRLSSKESTGSRIEGLREKMQELQNLYDVKCSQLQDRQKDLQGARLELKELQLLAKAANEPLSVVPAKMAAGLGVAGGSQEAEELQRLFLWLAEHLVLEEPTQFNAAFDLVMNDHHVHFRNIVQWRLRQSELRLSVPEELASEISSLLLAARRDPKTICEARAKTIIDSWSLTSSEALSDTLSRVTLLTQQETGKSCLVANFPLPPPVEAPPRVSVGDSVEVNFEGQWFKGIVKFIEDGSMTHVHCDVDPPDVMTKAPMHMLRRPVNFSAAPKPVSQATQPVPNHPLPSPKVKNQVVPQNQLPSSEEDIKRSTVGRSAVSKATRPSPEVESNIVPQNPPPPPDEDITTPTHMNQA